MTDEELDKLRTGTLVTVSSAYGGIHSTSCSRARSRDARGTWILARSSKDSYTGLLCSECKHAESPYFKSEITGVVDSHTQVYETLRKMAH